MNIQQIIKQHHLELLFQQGTFGIERGKSTGASDGSIVTSSHPKAFGNRRFHLTFKQILQKVSWN